LYGTFRCSNPNFKDPLIGGLTNNIEANKFLDGWGVSHFLFYFLLTLFFPQHWLFITLIGISWEIIETRPFYILNCKAYDLIKTDPDYTPWWYGRWQDIIMNSSGVTLAIFIRTYLWKLE
jgi:hypothetical protein